MHLDDDTLLALLDGEPAHDDARAHLAGCASCAAGLAALARLEAELYEVRDASALCPGCQRVSGAADEVRCSHCGVVRSAGPYRVLSIIAESDHSRVYLAESDDGVRVALKELLFSRVPDVEVLDAFEREARILKKLDHPRVPRFVASFTEGEGVHTRLYLAQEHVPGEPLLERLEGRSLDEREGIDVARQVLRVLAGLQALSPPVFHRDIKPQNVIRRPDGSLVLVDFGAARDKGATKGATAVGTFGYMPPEQLAGVVSKSTDLFGLGATLLHLLSGRAPMATTYEDELARLNVSPAFAQFLACLVAAREEDRFDDATAALAALERLPERFSATRSHSSATRSQSSTTRSHSSATRSRAFAVTAMVALCAGGVISAQQFLVLSSGSRALEAALPVPPARAVVDEGGPRCVPRMRSPASLDVAPGRIGYRPVGSSPDGGAVAFAMTSPQGGARVIGYQAHDRTALFDAVQPPGIADADAFVGSLSDTLKRHLGVQHAIGARSLGQLPWCAESSVVRVGGDHEGELTWSLWRERCEGGGHTTQWRLCHRDDPSACVVAPRPETACFSKAPFLVDLYEKGEVLWAIVGRPLPHGGVWLMAAGARILKPFRRIAAADPVSREDVVDAAVPAEATRETLSAADVLTVIKRELPTIEACGRRHGVSDTLKMQWRIDRSGATHEVAAVDRERAATPVATCAQRAIAQWRFPAFTGKPPPMVKFPFRLGG